MSAPASGATSHAPSPPLTAAPTRHRLDTALRALIALLEALMGVGALYGGVSLMRDTFGLPQDWLEATPFATWTVPGLLLLMLIAVPGLVGAAAEARGQAWVLPWSLAYGIGLVLWIAVQVTMVPPFVLQPVVATVGVMIAAASAWRLWLRRAGAAERTRA
jgi:hypothetical protein